MAWQVEKVHEELYRKALDAVETNQPLEQIDYYVCPICGFTHEGPLQGNCPICKTSAEKFERIS
jgi:rubrerythrin